MPKSKRSPKELARQFRRAYSAVGHPAFYLIIAVLGELLSGDMEFAHHHETIWQVLAELNGTTVNQTDGRSCIVPEMPQCAADEIAARVLKELWLTNVDPLWMIFGIIFCYLLVTMGDNWHTKESVKHATNVGLKVTYMTVFGLAAVVPLLMRAIDPTNPYIDVTQSAMILPGSVLAFTDNILHKRSFLLAAVFLVFAIVGLVAYGNDGKAAVGSYMVINVLCVAMVERAFEDSKLKEHVPALIRLCCKKKPSGAAAQALVTTTGVDSDADDTSAVDQFIQQYNLLTPTEQEAVNTKIAEIGSTRQLTLA